MGWRGELHSSLAKGRGLVEHGLESLLFTSSLRIKTGVQAIPFSFWSICTNFFTNRMEFTCLITS